jgi:hypothetical protein
MEISQLGLRLHSQVHCPICEHQFILSLTPGAPLPDGRPRGSQIDAFVASEPAAPLPEGTRKAKPPFRALVEAEPEVRAAPAKPHDRVVPFAPLPESDVPTMPDRYGPDGSGTGKNRSPGRWWKELPDRKQKMVLGLVIGLFAFVVFGWTALQSAAGPVVETAVGAAAASQGPALSNEQAPDPEATPVIEDELPPPATATGELASAPLTLLPPAQTVAMPRIDQVPVPHPGRVIRPSGS